MECCCQGVNVDIIFVMIFMVLQEAWLRRLMTFAWPCLLSKNCVDPATKYHGHLLLSHIIAKFAIHKRIVLQVTEDGPLISNLVFQSYYCCYK